MTADVAAPLDPDLVPFATACAHRVGADGVRIVSWDDPDVDWASFDSVIIRSTWDYTDRLDEFLAWVERTSSVARLLNSPDAVRWSADKRYLAELATLGISIAPTTFVEPGQSPPVVEGVHVVKPTVGAGSSGARRCEADEVADHVAALHREGRTAMVQPYLDLLDERGESAYCYVPGVDGGLELSHVFRKGAILTTVDVEQEGDLFAKEDISDRRAEPAELVVADAVLDVVSRFDDVAFARIDIAPHRAADGTESFVVLEVELIEPSFYLHTAPGSAELFADRLLARLARHLDSTSGR